jgi:hypothetical protein
MDNVRLKQEGVYLDFAELQATNGRLMKMQDRIDKLDDFLRISEKKLFSNTRKISHKQAIEKAKKNMKNTAEQNTKKILTLTMK